jgi:hypothetical protein
MELAPHDAERCFFHFLLGGNTFTMMSEHKTYIYVLKQAANPPLAHNGAINCRRNFRLSSRFAAAHGEFCYAHYAWSGENSHSGGERASLSVNRRTGLIFKSKKLQTPLSL